MDSIRGVAGGNFAPHTIPQSAKSPKADILEAARADDILDEVAVAPEELKKGVRKRKKESSSTPEPVVTRADFPKRKNRVQKYNEFYFSGAEYLDGEMFENLDLNGPGNLNRGLFSLEGEPLPSAPRFIMQQE